MTLPKVSIDPNSSLVDTCSEAVFKCTVNGFGKINVTWRKVDDEFPETADVITTDLLNQRISTLTIRKMVWYFKGIYYCVASNSAGEVNSSLAYLNVTGNDNFTHCKLYTYMFITVPCPKMIRTPEDIVVRPGKAAIFNCLAWSFGGLVYEWQKSKLPPNKITSFNIWSSPNDPSFMAMSYELTLPDVKMSYEGYYCCVASNACGNTTRCAWLEVDSKFVHNTNVCMKIIVIQ